MTTVYVVAHQAYIYPQNADNELKYIMNENFDVEGVFSTIENATTFMRTRIKSIADDLYGKNLRRGDYDYKSKKKFIHEEEPDHWSVYEFELDKPKEEEED